MGRRRKNTLPFDNRGGVIVLSRRVVESENYLSLTVYAKVLMILLQQHWRNDKAVNYGIREAAAKIPCDRRTAMKAFNQLQHQGFIICTELSFFCSRTQSKSRSWRLEWMPFNDQPPTNKWEQWTSD